MVGDKRFATSTARNAKQPLACQRSPLIDHRNVLSFADEHGNFNSLKATLSLDPHHDANSPTLNLCFSAIDPINSVPIS